LPQEKTNKVVEFRDWLTEVKHVDNLMHSEHTELESLQKLYREASRRSNTLTEPSRKPTRPPLPIQPPLVQPCSGYLPKLTDAERHLLFNNEGCLKCRQSFVSHHSADCPNDFLNSMSIAAVTEPAQTATASSSARIAPVAAVIWLLVCPRRIHAVQRYNVIGTGEDSDGS